MHSFAQRVLSHIRQQELLKAGDRVGVAVSGGIDSVALLRLLLELRAELGIVLSVVHFNHKLRGAESDADEEFVAALARAHDLQFFSDSDDVAQQAADERVSVETAARELRYGFFRSLLGEDGPQGLKPASLSAPGGTAEAVPFPVPDPSLDPPSRGAEAPLFHGDSNSAGGRHTRSSLDKIATGHTLDDQAETVLMRMIRGAGLRGLGGIHPRIAVEDDDGEVCGEIVRPLLEIRRLELEQYLREIGQDWREDSSNSDAAFTRNRVRKLLVPLLEKEFNPSVAENLSELAEIARGEEDYWENEIAGWMGTAVHWSEPEWALNARSGAGLVQIAGFADLSGEIPTSRAAFPNQSRAREMGHPALSQDGPQGLKPTPKAASDGTAEAVPFPSRDSSPDASSLRDKIDNAPCAVMNAAVDRLWFLGEPAAVQRRLIKAVGDQAGIPLEFKHVEEIVHFAAEDGPSGKHLSLPLGWKIVREPDELIFVTPDLRDESKLLDYEYELSIPGRVIVPEAGCALEVRRVGAGSAVADSTAVLFDAASIIGTLTIRNWRAGDRFWPPHTKAPKKIKELLQERHIAQPDRKLWPVLAAGDEIVWVRGFGIPAKFRPRPGQDAILLVESPLDGAD